MARIRWTSPALDDLRAVLQWFDEHTEPSIAFRVALDIEEAARRAAANPGGFAWVGSLHPALAVLPPHARRVLTRPRRHVLYYRFLPDLDEIQVLAIRGVRQLPPTPDELGA